MRSVKYLVFLVVILFPAICFATNLRGRVDAVHSYSNAPFPARGIQVQLFLETPEGPKLAASYATGGDGMYYLQNIAPGNYTLVVNNNLRFPITVSDTRFQDLPPVLIRY